MKYFVDAIYDSLNHVGEELCGDKVEVVRKKDGFIMVLADGLGSGVKANILSTLTSKIIATMLSEGGSIDDAVSTITATLPVCSERNLAYSTFTIVNVDDNGHVIITEFDNPLCVAYRNKVFMPLERKNIDVFGKQIYVCEFDAEPGDILVAFSDGVVHAGVGSLLDLGWMYENVVDYVGKIVAKDSSIREILHDVLSSVNAFYLDKPGDDSTVCVMEFKTNVEATVMVGPPKNMEKDAEVVSRLMHSPGYKVVCGGTTSQIVAKMLHTDVDVVINYENPAVPPTASIEGIDLVTEGVLTLGKCVQILEGINDESNSNRLNYMNLDKNDGATKLAKLLCDECTNVNFLVGCAINPAHQNPDLPITLNIKLQLVRECCLELEKMGKTVHIDYF